MYKIAKLHLNGPRRVGQVPHQAHASLRIARSLVWIQSTKIKTTPATLVSSKRLLPQQLVVVNSGVRLRETTKGAITHMLHDALLSGCKVNLNDPQKYLGARVCSAAAPIKRLS